MTELLFVYNADSGLFNTALDIAHKIFSPSTYQCKLCELTHGHFQIRKQWQQFAQSLAVNIAYCHKDEYEKNNPPAENYPFVLIQENNKSAEVLVSADELGKCESLESFIDLLRERLKSRGIE